MLRGDKSDNVPAAKAMEVKYSKLMEQMVADGEIFPTFQIWGKF